MDIHRCRFVQYQPQSINALAFSHTSSKQRSPTDLRLALGRENGDIEIWNPNGGHWVQEKIFRGSDGRTIEQLAWTQDLVLDDDNTDRPIDEGQLRLFSSGGSTSITEWNLANGTQKRHAEGNFGEIWCFAAQPQWRASLKKQELSNVAASPSQMLAAGCSDGTVVLFSTADDSLQYLRTLAQPSSKKTKVISITWKDRNTIVAGYENSQIRVIDVNKRTTIRTMSLGKPADGSDIVVWAVKCLPDGTLLSGDSTGELKIWDAVNHSLVQRLKTHDADILDISTSSKGDLIFTAGVDRRTVAYQPLVTEKGKGRDRWQQIMHRRFHQHDVKALAAFESKEMGVLVSGGMDTVPMVMPLRKFELEYHRSLPHLPQKPQMSCSAERHLMLTWWDRSLLIRQLPSRKSLLTDDVGLQLGDGDHKLLAKIELSGEEGITSAQISPNGQMVAAATSAGTKLFQLRESTSHGRSSIRSRSLDLPAGIKNFGATLAGFSPDSKWLYAVRSTNVVALVKILPTTDLKGRPQVHQRVIKLARKARKVKPSKLGDYRQSINCLSFSADSRIIASGDLSGSIDVWVLEGHEDVTREIHASPSNQLDGSGSDSDEDSDSDSDDETDTAVIHGQKWIRNPSGSQLSQLESAIIALSFKPLHTSSKAAEPETVGIHATRNNPHPVSPELPQPAKLVSITSQHNISEFDVLSSRLSEWSRRNPSIYLPNKFTQLKDRVMGIFWDCSSSYERMYMYGSGFVFMIDLAHDLNPVDAQEKIGQIGKYAVREALPETGDTALSIANHRESTILNKRKRKRNGGAGDAIKNGEWSKRDATTDVSLPRENGDKTETNSSNIGLPSPVSDYDDEDDEMDTDMQDSALATFRRQTDAMDDLDGIAKSQLHEDTKLVSTSHGPHYFSTFRYRSIFGVSPLAPTHSIDAVSGQVHNALQDEIDDVGDLKPSIPALEVVIVERPLYDVELLPRFEGGQDWGS